MFFRRLSCRDVDELVAILRSLKIGCHIKKVFMAALLYADDMALLAPSLKGLQRLLNACSDFCKEWDVCLNAKKSKLLYFEKSFNELARPKLNNLPLEWVETWMYLGVKLVSGKRFGCTVVDRIKKYYKCANAIFRIEGRSDDLIMLKLIEAHCVPILTYAIEVTVFTDRNEQSKIRAAYNSLFRRIFGYRTYESVTELQLALARPTWEMLVEDRKVGFHRRLESCNADSPVHVFSLF